MAHTGLAHTHPNLTPSPKRRLCAAESDSATEQRLPNVMAANLEGVTSMSRRWRAVVLAGPALMGAWQATAQQPSPNAAIRARILAFYRDERADRWPDILSHFSDGKVTARWPAPTSDPAWTQAVPPSDAGRCASSDGGPADRLTIVVVGRWARVFVTQCSGAAAADELWLLRIGDEWKIAWLVRGARCRRPDARPPSCGGVHLPPFRRAEHYMGMPQATRRWTAELVRALPDDGNRYEVIAGELFVTPAPRLLHQRAIAELLFHLRPYVDQHRLGELLASPADIEFDPETMVQPDAFVAPLVEGRRPREWTDVRQLRLAIEVLSPTTARGDRSVKRRLYQRVGVPEYWIVDLEAQLVERWRPADERPEVLTESLGWQPDPAVAPHVIDLAGFFSKILAEQ